MATPNSDHVHPKFIEITFSFHEFAPACKISVHSIYQRKLFYVPPACKISVHSIYQQKIRLCHALLRTGFQHHTKIQKKLMIQFQENAWIEGRTERRKDGQTLFYRILPAAAGRGWGPIMTYSSANLFRSLLSIRVTELLITHLHHRYVDIWQDFGYGLRAKRKEKYLHIWICKHYK